MIHVVARSEGHGAAFLNNHSRFRAVCGDFGSGLSTITQEDRSQWIRSMSELVLISLIHLTRSR